VQAHRRHLRGDFIAAHSLDRLVVRSPQMASLAPLVEVAGGSCQPDPEAPGTATISGLTDQQVGHLAARHQVPLFPRWLVLISLFWVDRF